HGTIHWQHHPARIEKSSLQEVGAAERADVAQVRGDSRPLAVDAMTAGASARYLEPSPSAIGVAQGSCVAVKIAHVADIGDDSGDFGWVKTEGRHRRSRDAVRQNGAQILIG